MRSLLAMLLIAGLVLALVGCGGSKVRADEALTGKYIPVTGKVDDFVMPAEDLEGFAFELSSGGKAVATIDGDEEDISWKNDDTTITLVIDKEDVTGTLGKDLFTIENMFDTGVSIPFAKEGTAAADPALYLPESEKFMLGKWRSESVTDVLGDPVDDMEDDALSLEFSADHRVKVFIDGELMGTHNWSNLDDWGSLDDSDLSLSWDVLDDGIEVDYSPDGDYYIFFCPKS
jgi:hypothetical protein